MGPEEELVLPARTVETPPTVEPEAPPPRLVVGHGTPQHGKIDPDISGISPSKMEPARKLNPAMGYDPETRTVISEEEYLERIERQRAVDAKCREIETRAARWAGKSEEEILLGEIALVRRGTLKDPTWSFYATKDGFQAHLFGVTETVTQNQLEYTRRSKTWHVLAQGIIQRLRRKAARQMDIEQTPRPEVYREQVAMLAELVKEAGGELYLAEIEVATEGIREPSTKAKTQVHHLLRFLGAFIREKSNTETGTCRTEAEMAAAGAAEPADSRSQDQEEAAALRAENAHLRRRLEAIELALTGAKE